MGNREIDYKKLLIKYMTRILDITYIEQGCYIDDVYFSAKELQELERLEKEIKETW